MKKLAHPVSSAMISALILTNAISGVSYVKDHNEYESKIHNQSKIIKHYKKVDAKNRQLINQKDKEIDSRLSEISKYKGNIDKLNKQLDQLKKENKQLKRYGNGKEVDGQTFIITAYTANQESTGKTNGDTAYGITASGINVQEGTTVACPPSLKFGTKVNIENIGIRVCEDRGGSINSNHIDLYVENLNKAINFGVQTLRVEILN